MFLTSLEIILKDAPEVYDMLKEENIDNTEIPQAVRDYISSVTVLYKVDESITIDAMLKLKPEERLHLQKKLSKPVKSQNIRCFL